MDINIQSYEQKLYRIAADYNLKPEQIVFVDDRIQWLKDHNLEISPTEHPRIYATTFYWYKTNKWEIIIKKVITYDDVISCILKLKDEAFPNVNIFKVKNNDVEFRKEIFAIFTLLHEIAHTQKIQEESKADLWAYNELKKYYKLD